MYTVNGFSASVILSLLFFGQLLQHKSHHLELRRLGKSTYSCGVSLICRVGCPISFLQSNVFHTLHTTDHSFCSFSSLHHGWPHPPQELLNQEHLTYVAGNAPFVAFSNHVSQEICIFPNDTPHEIIASSVIFQNLPLDFGFCLLCPHRQVLPLEYYIFASLCQASEGMVEYFYGLKPFSDEAFLVFGINGSNCFIHRFPEKKRC